MSTLTWLDFSDAERKRALQVVELLGRPETRDELGLGAIRDAFANALVPRLCARQLLCSVSFGSYDCDCGAICPASCAGIGAVWSQPAGSRGHRRTLFADDCAECPAASAARYEPTQGSCQRP